MKFKIITGFKFIPADGMVLYPFVLIKQPTPNKIILNHELVHVSQIRKEGFFKFYTKYLFEYLSNRIKGMQHQNAYMAISYEVEAYSTQYTKPHQSLIDEANQSWYYK